VRYVFIRVPLSHGTRVNATRGSMSHGTRMNVVGFLLIRSTTCVALLTVDDGR